DLPDFDRTCTATRPHFGAHTRKCVPPPGCTSAPTASRRTTDATFSAFSLNFRGQASILCTFVRNDDCSFGMHHQQGGPPLKQTLCRHLRVILALSPLLRWACFVARKVQGGVDQRNVRKGLRKISELPL